MLDWVRCVDFDIGKVLCAREMMDYEPEKDYNDMGKVYLNLP